MGFTYPPGSFAVTGQAQTSSYNPKVFFLGVGTQFPNYPEAAGGRHDGVMGTGGVDAARSSVQGYFARHEEFAGRPPDSWASAVTYASLEVLAQAIKRVGVDRKAVVDEIASGAAFDTVIGPVKFKDNQYRDLWWTGQWQNGKFVGVAPAGREGAVPPVIPKPAW